MKKIKYFAIIAASIFTLTSCTDIVEVDDLKAKENKPSTGAPTVDKVVFTWQNLKKVKVYLILPEKCNGSAF